MKVRRPPPSSLQDAEVLERLGRVLDKRPVLVAVAGPNGAGKTTFYHAHLKPAGLRFLNADEFVRDLEIDPYEAAKLVTQLRLELVRQRESFIFETVFSDPVGDKLGFLKDAVRVGYTVVLCFVGVGGPNISEQRVAMRVSQGGHDVPSDKLASRFPRTMANLRVAIRELPYVFVFDNDDLSVPFRRVAVFELAHRLWSGKQIPDWLADLET